MDRGPIRKSSSRSTNRAAPYKLRSEHPPPPPPPANPGSGPNPSPPDPGAIVAEPSPPPRHEDKPSYLLCPICFDCIAEPHMTKCGHSFCYECITRSLETSDRCPKCSSQIEARDDIYPNFVLNDIVSKFHGTGRHGMSGYEPVDILVVKSIGNNTHDLVLGGLMVVQVLACCV